MRTPRLIATLLTLALVAACAATAAIAAPVPDPIAHAAGQHGTPSVPGVTEPGDPYVDPFGHHHGHHPDPYVDPVGPTPGHHTGHAYGKACSDESRKHVDGVPGTPFSECVHALKVLASGKKHSAVAACKAESHQHVKGHKGTPFSRCVADAHKLAHAKRARTVRVAGPR